MANYTDRTDQTSNQWHAEQRAHTQDVYANFRQRLDAGPVDMDRRHSCRENFLLFCETYGGPAFSLAWSDNHRRAAELIESAAMHGEQFAFAMPRGSGKTTLSRWAVVWAVLYGHSPYSVLIGKTQKSAEKLLKSIKSSLRFSDLLFEDFPEIIAPIRHLKGETRKAQGQKFRSEPTQIEWSQGQIVLGYLPAEWMHDQRRKWGDDYGAGCGSIIDVTGIEGEIRGRQYERPSGEILRPTFAVVDDPQDRESAKSPSQCDDREQAIKADIRYLAGPDRPTGIVIPCTVIYEDDLAFRLLDRKKNPDFQGERTRLVESFPGTGLPEADRRRTEHAVEEYRRIRNEGMEAGDKGRAANEYYRANRSTIEAGAKTSWPERYFADQGEVSAIQHALNLFFADETAFMAEYQNEPIRSVTDEISLPSADEIAKRLSGTHRGRVPNDQPQLTAFIDVSQTCLWWMVCSWGPGFSGTIIDYGIFPDQRKSYVTLSGIKTTLGKQAAKAIGATSFEASLAWGLEQLTSKILGGVFLTESGVSVKPSMCLIDTNWQQSTAVVNAFCRRSSFASILFPARGRGVTSPDDGLIDPRTKPKPGERRGQWWKILPNQHGGRYVLQSSNHWKSFLFHRFAVPPGDPGSLMLFQDRPSAHKMLCEQLTAETCTRVKVKGDELDTWKEAPGRDNHFLDCAVGCLVGASILGMKLESHKTPVTKRVKKRRGGVSYLA